MEQDRRWKLFQCQQCGRCCFEIGLPYDPESISAIAQFLNLTKEQVIEKYYGRIVNNGWLSEDRKRTPCPFLTADGHKKKCAIYQVRPKGCRLYPFKTDFGTQDVDCPGARTVYVRRIGPG